MTVTNLVYFPEPGTPPLEASTAAPRTGQPSESTSNMLLPKFGSALLPAFIVMELLTGGTSIPARQPEPSLSVSIYQTLPRIAPSGVNERQDDTFLPELARSVRSLRDRSGLTWDELAYIFGVSRRTLYNWSTGGKVSAPHAQAIATVVQTVHRVDTGDPQLTRSRLLAPSEDGTTIYTRLARRSVPPAITGPAHRPDELLTSTPDSYDPTGPLVDFEQLT
jgi:DNA-binding XRE family transcriptional regulator